MLLEDKDPARFPHDWALPLKPYSVASLCADLRAFDYVLLSHFPPDLQINSMAKSPNKAITALVAGAIPIATDTPAYRALFNDLGLTQWLFDAPRQLDACLGRLDPQADSQAVQASGALQRLRTRYNDARAAHGFPLLQQHRLVDAGPGATVRREIPQTLEQFETERVKLTNRIGRAPRSRLSVAD